MGEQSDGGGKPRQNGAQATRTEGARPVRRLRLALWALVAVGLGAAIAAGAGRQAAAPAGDETASQSAAAQVGGPFRLTDQTGRAVDQSILKGKWSLVFFGYTSCPDVCPTTLQALAAAQDRLGPDAAKTQVVLISVDPDRDRPQELKAYLDQPGFPKGAVGLTGTPRQVGDVARAYRAYYKKRPRSDGSGYDMDHSGFIYLMDPNGRFRLPTLSGQQGPDAIAATVRAAIQKG